MGFHSLAHKKKLEELLKQGKISAADFKKHETESFGKKLPERIHPKKEKK